ncbi:MAG: helix-turn-helix domain-containing protein [Clostridiales bacterium]|uniref:helix-turn-helix domain-containing protein n=1 Tax=Flavonifractor porci TaxID=3133422 RepID=UPI0030AF0E1D|nr:helix-turn-helix domain-containing protein [Clostridiales bacterium]
MELTERLAQARKTRGLSQADAAERLNVSRQAISRWETGVGTPSLDSLIQMSQLYGLSLNELVYGPEAAKPREEVTEPEAQPERPAVREPHRRRTALLTVVLSLATAGILGLGIWVGFGVAGTSGDAKMFSDDLVVEENVNVGEEFDLVPWE